MNFTELEKHFSADFESLAALESQVLTPIFTHADSDVNYTPINQRIDLTETMKRTAQRSHISDVWQAGKYTLGDGEELQLLEVVLADDCNIMRSRVGIQSTIRQLRFDCALIVFRYQNSASRRWRLSYVEKGNTQAQNTSAKRFTYLFGAGVGCRTAAERFTKLANTCDITKADLTAAFSVEALTKEFYHELFEWYLWAIDPQTGITFPNDTNIEEDDREDLETKVIRMITRIMFVWFIKQKQLVPERIFKVEYLQTILSNFDPQSTTQSSYYNAILQNLFFATLNRAIIDAQGNQRHFATANKRDIKTLYRYAEMFTIGQQEVIDLFAEVPFLNGGLFECLDKTRTIDGVERAYNFDGFSRNDRTFADGRYRNRAVVPNHLFFAHGRGLFDILARYNFTIEENTPEEQQVALDPELLGKVFENLLGAYNPETKETARNQSGSFYTPREIVNYMVDQSLIAYLGNTPFARQLFAPNFEYDSQCQTQYTAAANKLKQIKILDPACGSGAFPMGLLNRMVEVLQRLQPDEDPYQQKLFIIQNCLYGSDIQCIAAQITKLRFFISLICDCQRTGTAADNYGIPVLPNLETKFVAANSLRSIKRGKNVQLNLFDTSEIENLKAELHNVRRKHFDATSASQKITLRQRDQELRQQLANIINQLNGTTSAETNFLLEWNPYDQNTSAPLFDPEWMFGVKEFDVVIGNPPYVQLQNNGGALAKLFEACGFETFARTGDIYCLFYERGCQLLRQGGHLCYITSNKWMRAGYGELTRAFLAKRTNPLQLIDFEGEEIFESATVYTNILLLEKAKNAGCTQSVSITKLSPDDKKNMSVFLQHHATTCSFTTADSWVILSPIEQSIKRKIEAVGTPLKDWDIQIYRGVLTGYNEAFIISSQKREEILSACKSEEEKKRTAAIIRPILRGRDIKRYGYEWDEENGQYLIGTHNGWCEHKENGEVLRVPAIDINEYPALKAHLDQYWDKLEKRTDKGVTPYNLRNCAYWNDFSQQKIIYPETTTGAYFVLDTDKMLLDKTCFMIICQDAEYLQAALSSKLYEFAYKRIFSSVVLGEHGYQYNKHALIKLPIIKEYEELESYSDSYFYNKYDLTKDEIRFIENSFR